MIWRGVEQSRRTQAPAAVSWRAFRLVESAPPSTLGAEIEEGIRMINGKAGPLSFVPSDLPFHIEPIDQP